MRRARLDDLDLSLLDGPQRLYPQLALLDPAAAQASWDEALEMVQAIDQRRAEFLKAARKAGERVRKGLNPLGDGVVAPKRRGRPRSRLNGV